MAKIGDVGTLRELDVKPGDVVEMLANRVQYKVEDWMLSNTEDRFRLISRAVQATPTPKLWKDMTPEERGALLLAEHEGKVIQFYELAHGYEGWQVATTPAWNDSDAYRVKPEPVRETVVFDDKEYSFKIMKGHRITFDLIDGVPDCNSVKMEAI